MHTCPVCGCECDCQGDIEDHDTGELYLLNCCCPCVEFAEDEDTIQHSWDEREEFDEDNNNPGDAARKDDQCSHS